MKICIIHKSNANNTKTLNLQRISMLRVYPYKVSKELKIMDNNDNGKPVELEIVGNVHFSLDKGASVRLNKLKINDKTITLKDSILHLTYNHFLMQDGIFNSEVLVNLGEYNPKFFEMLDKVWNFVSSKFDGETSSDIDINDYHFLMVCLNNISTLQALHPTKGELNILNRVATYCSDNWFPMHGICKDLYTNDNHLTNLPTEIIAQICGHVLDISASGE